MKAYLYNEETGLYEGEDFVEDGTLQDEDGITRISPPEYEHGQVPVFDRQKKTWTVIPITIARQLLNTSTSESTERKL